ncbi:hypothetical protein [Streptomyces xanthii]|uniref:Protein kinase domain-containing protein n=1 Tax=Streptomyces xanthii TaxID=2768069 RepID=A0A7H1BHA8_9ACTN|nr:hypothetical protein [Streptomyces xanthii]QNS08113.1 hypothetical protein IAG42_33880 [Streptomyces xanthii]
MKSPGPERDVRLAAHGGVATALALLSDDQVRERLDAAAPLGAGIGGTSTLLDVDGTPVLLPDELADVERAVAYWGGGAEVRHRIEELARASATVALFLEYIPRNLHDWLGAEVAAGGARAGRACAMVEAELAAGTAFMNARGLLHFDAHFENILTDGRRLFFTDYGLALSSRFALTPDEAGFFDRHDTYDRCYTVNHLVNWLAFALYRHGPDARRAFVRACAKGDVPADVPPGIAAALLRHAAVAEVMGDFLRELRQDSRSTRCPAEALRGLQRTGKPNV